MIKELILNTPVTKLLHLNIKESCNILRSKKSRHFTIWLAFKSSPKAHLFFLHRINYAFDTSTGLKSITDFTCDSPVMTADENRINRCQSQAVCSTPLPSRVPIHRNCASPGSPRWMNDRRMRRVSHHHDTETRASALIALVLGIRMPVCLPGVSLFMHRNRPTYNDSS